MKILVESLRNLFSSENDFFALAKKGKRITHIALTIPLIIVFLIGAMIISQGIVLKLILQKIDLSEEIVEFYNLFISFGFVIIVVWLWVRLFEKRSLKSLGFSKNKAFKNYLKGFLSGLFMLSLVIALMALFGAIGFQQNPKPLSYHMWGLFLLMLIGYVVQGAAEEVLARGWQFQVIGARYKPWLGALISSLVFAMLHGFNTGITVLVIINLMLFAFLLIFFILYDKSIWAACGWHTAWNWSMENIFGLKVSGNEGFGSMFSLSATGSDFISGGDFGPEGSIFTSVILIAGMIALIVLNHMKIKHS